MMRVAVGDPALLAIEAELEEPLDPRWLFGHFRLTVRDQELGDWDDLATLRGIVSWWDAFVSSPRDRWDARLDGLGATEIFQAVKDGAYEETQDAGFAPDAFERFHVNQLGMSAFDPYVVIVAEPPERGQWLMWCREDDAEAATHIAKLPPGTLQTVGSHFVELFRDRTLVQPDPSGA